MNSNIQFSINHIILSTLKIYYLTVNKNCVNMVIYELRWYEFKLIFNEYKSQV